jgi:hypothetical protein
MWFDVLELSNHLGMGPLLGATVQCLRHVMATTRQAAISSAQDTAIKHDKQKQRKIPCQSGIAAAFSNASVKEQVSDACCSRLAHEHVAHRSTCTSGRIMHTRVAQAAIPKRRLG